MFLLLFLSKFLKIQKTFYKKFFGGFLGQSPKQSSFG